MVKQKIIFTPDECDKIIKLEKTHKQIWEGEDRFYESELIVQNEDSDWIFEKLKTFFENEINIKVDNIKKGIHFHKFTKNTYFDIHTDDLAHRIYSIGVLLNEDYKGGDFVLYGNENITLQRKKGNAYIFDVSIPHEIKKISDGIRYSIICFITDENITIPAAKKRII